MARIGTMVIAGKQYPMSLSLGASKRIAQKYGDIQVICNTIKTDNLLDDKTLDILIDIAEILIAQGCAYKNMFEKDLPWEPDAPVDADGRYIPLSKEEIEVGIALSDMREFSSAIFYCLGVSQKKEIELESNPGEKKQEAIPET